MKNLVIYHKSDFDGIFCREIVKAAINADFIGWDYGDPVPEVKDYDLVYMLDISIDPLMTLPNLVWIDHHKTAIDKYSSTITGYRIDGVAACRLAWQWFHVSGVNLHTREDFISREVLEPVAVRLAGEYDIWDKRDPDAEVFQHGLKSVDELDWKYLLTTNEEVSTPYIKELLDNGYILQKAKQKENDSIINDQSYYKDFEGLRFLVCNHARFNSFLFTGKREDTSDAYLGYCYDGSKKAWKVSLYHRQGKEHHDLSLIAKKYGGGGHKGACGFICNTEFLKDNLI